MYIPTYLWTYVRYVHIHINSTYVCTCVTCYVHMSVYFSDANVCTYSMHIRMYSHTHIRRCVDEQVYTYVCTYLFVYTVYLCATLVCVHSYVGIYTHTVMYIRTYVHGHAHKMMLRIYIRMYVCRILTDSVVLL